MTRTLIVNADDFGLAIAVNAGIEDAHRHGILTSATILANGPAFDDAVARARALPSLGVGVHLNLLRGRPLGDPKAVRPLLGPDGRMRGGFLSAGWRCRDAAFLRAAEAEYRAQIETCLAAGLSLTHTDSEKHHVAWPRLAKVVERLSAEFGIPAIRRPVEAVCFSARRLPWRGLGCLGRAALLRCVTEMRRSGLPTPDHFFGQTHIGAMTEGVWLALLANLPEGVTEVMTHPGPEDAAEMARAAETMGASWIDSRRAAECRALMSPEVRGAVDAAGIVLATYAAVVRAEGEMRAPGN